MYMHLMYIYIYIYLFIYLFNILGMHAPTRVTLDDSGRHWLFLGQRPSLAARLSNPWGKARVAVKELKIRYHNSDTILIIIYPEYGSLKKPVDYNSGLLSINCGLL